MQFVGVAGRDDPGPASAFVTTFDVGGFPHVLDDDGSVWADFGVATQPAFAFVAADGSYEVEIGQQGEDSLAERLDALLGAA